MANPKNKHIKHGLHKKVTNHLLTTIRTKLDEGDSAAVVQLIVPIVNIPTTQLHPAYTPPVELLELEIGPNLTNN